MKGLKLLVGSVLTVFAFAAFAGDNLVWTNQPPIPSWGQSGFSLAGQTNTIAGVGVSWAIIPADSRFAPGGAPIVDSFSALGDAAGSQVRSYFTGAPTPVVYTNSTVTLYVANTNGFGAAMIFIIRHVGSHIYERNKVSSFVGSTNIVVTTAPTFEVDPGDLIYPVQQQAAITIGVATVTRDNSRGIFFGNVDAAGNGYPFLIEATGTSNCALQHLSGYFDH